MTDFAALDRYLARRYPPSRRRASVLAKSLLPVAALSRSGVSPAPADVLLLHPHPGARARHEALAQALASKGLRVAHEVLPGGRELLADRRFSAPRAGWSATPRAWRLQAGYAAWLCARYRPRVLVTFMDDSTHSPFLREAVRESGGVAVNVAHAMCWPNMDFSMCDFDWLLLWGRRSLEALRAAPVRFGACRTLEVGSIYLRAAAPPAPGPMAEPRLLWIGQDLGSAHREALLEDARALAGFAASHPRVRITVRAHPLDRGELRRVLEPSMPRAQWSDATRPLSEALGETDIAASSFSAGLVDAAAASRPVIAFATSGLADPIGLADHGLPVVRDAASLGAAVEAIAAQPEPAQRAAASLAREHLHGLDDATPRCAAVLEALAGGRDPAALGFPESKLESRE